MTKRQTEEAKEFVDGPIDGVIFKPLETRVDGRGWLVELYRMDELAEEHRPVMAYVSQTLPGIARGPHEHVNQTDYFAFMGPGDFTVFLWDARHGSPTLGHRTRVVLGESNKQGVIVPPGVVHAYRNDGETPAWVFNAANLLYAGKGRHGPVDEIRHEDREDGPYRMD